MKRLLRLFAVLFVALLLVGCVAPKLNFTIEPNPITLEFGQMAIEGVTLHVKMSGLGINYTVEAALMELFDEEGEAAMEPIKKELDTQIPVVVGGIGQEVDLPSINLEEFYAGIHPDLSEAIYAEELQGKVYTLKITLTGKNPTSNTVEIEFH